MLLLLMLIALALLATLTAIDAKTFLLPDRYVFLYGLSGLCFHIASHFRFLEPLDMAFGALVGGGGLYLVRAIGNKVYGQESMGFGDVKLLFAGGLWVGAMGTVWAITAGAFATLVFALIFAVREWRKTGKFTYARLIFPAGPGFCIGLALVMLIQFGEF